MSFEFLMPVEEVLLAHSQLLPRQVLGRNIAIHSRRSGLPQFDGVQVAIFGVDETRNSALSHKNNPDLSGIRRELYQLFPGNWHTSIADLGDIKAGDTIEDSYFAVQDICSRLMAKNVIPLCVGGGHDLTYACYRSFDPFGSMVNIVSVDARFDFGKEEDLISSSSYMSKIITEKPHNLFNFSNIGYQTFANAQEEIDLVDKLFFEAYRLGEVKQRLDLVEPVLRDAHLVSIDLSCMASPSVGMAEIAGANGFDGMDICTIARYAGISNKVSLFGVFENPPNSIANKLSAQILWYFLEGVNCRIKDNPGTTDNDHVVYRVPLEDQELIFVKSTLTNRWWMKIPPIDKTNNKLVSNALLPCMYQDYLDACDQNIPQRWWRAFKKSLN